MRVVKHPKLKERNQNIKALQILINQYITNDKKEVVKKIKTEQ